MQYRRLDSTGDFSFGGGSNDFLKDVPEVVGQAVMTRLKLWKNEWFLDTADGTGWQDDVLGRGTSLLYEQMIRARILETVGVLSIDAFSSSYDADARALKMAVTITTIYGQTAVEGQL